MNVDNPNEWKEILATGVAILCLCLGLATCQYTEHRMDMEKAQISVKGKQ